MNISNKGQNPAAPSPVVDTGDTMTDEWAKLYTSTREKLAGIVHRLTDAEFSALFRLAEQERDVRTAKAHR